jgi:hypothetical protein
MKLKELLFTKILSFYIDFSSHYEIYYNVHATIHRKPRKFVVNDIDEERRLKKKLKEASWGSLEGKKTMANASSSTSS